MNFKSLAFIDLKLFPQSPKGNKIMNIVRLILSGTNSLNHRRAHLNAALPLVGRANPISPKLVSRPAIGWLPNGCLPLAAASE